MSSAAKVKKQISKMISDPKHNNEIVDLIQHYQLLVAEKVKMLDAYYMSDDADNVQGIPGKEKAKMEKLFFAASKNVFLKGYYLGAELLLHEDTKFEGDMLSKKTLDVRFPAILDKACAIPFYDLINTEETRQFYNWFIRTFEDVRQFIEHVLCEIGYIGALKALQIYREDKNVKVKNEHTSALMKVDITNVFPLTPAIGAYVVSGDSCMEMWNLVWRTTYSPEDPFKYIGDIVIIKKSVSQNKELINKGSIHSALLQEAVSEGMLEQGYAEVRIKIEDIKGVRPFSTLEAALLIEQLKSFIGFKLNIPEENILIWS
ncbi:hypothetical protein CN931_24105 [Bacillus sp. AFS054943]|uniref:Uncharacterized protein n=1 Tax=Bacillus cereus TaxID=1396 RepID=A0A2C1KVL7_BACCE|nr:MULTISPECIES: hypothetical protein [Bacillus]PGL78095.1 hypothetical protein CN931_24105 [Bacillus sp. AFS054943]PGT96645.1 hypothetical protein COD19_27175 [Bacillus cereus]